MEKKMLCQTAKQANNYSWGWMNRQPAVKEESITDWLLDFFHQKSPDVRYYQFDRHQEARYSGADWDWWFLLNKGCFKLRVQAKKVRKGKNHYQELARYNQYGYQIDLLLESSDKLNFYPIYSLYGIVEDGARCNNNGEIALSICAAHEINDVVFSSPRKRIESHDLFALSIPLECLFCCPLVEEFPRHGPQELFEHYFKVPPHFSNDRPDGQNRGYEAVVPKIIDRLFEMREINSNTESLLHEYQGMFSGSNGVVVTKVKDYKVD